MAHFWVEILSLHSRPKGLDLLWSYTAWRELSHQHQWYGHQHSLQDLPSSPLGQLGACSRPRERRAHTAPCCHPPRHRAARKGSILLHITCKGTRYMCSHKHPGSACDLMALCTTKFRIWVHPNPHCISLLRILLKTPDFKVWLQGPYLQARKRQQIKHRRNKHLHSFTLRTLIFQPVRKDPMLCSTIQTTQTVGTADPMELEAHHFIAKQQKCSFWKKSSINQNICCSINYSGKKEEHIEHWEQTTLPTRHGVSTVILTHVHFCVMLRHHLPRFLGKNLKLIVFLSSILKADGVWSYFSAPDRGSM